MRYFRTAKIFLLCAALAATQAIASPADAAATFVDTSTTDFGQGSTSDGALISNSSGGEVTLPSGVDTTFDGSSLPTGWSAVQEDGSTGTYSVSGGNLTLNGVRAGTDAAFSAGQTMEFRATFSSTGEFQHVGFGQTYTGTNAIAFSTQEGGALYAYTPDGVTAVDTGLTGTVLGVQRDYKIEWTYSTALFFVKNTSNDVWVQVASRNTNIYSNLRVSPSDADSSDDSFVVASLRVTPYARSIDTTFSGSSLPNNWSAVDNGGGSYSVSGGNMTLNGTRSGTDAVVGAGQTLDFNATFHPTAEYQHVGFAESYNNASNIIFSTQGGGSLVAYTPSGTTTIDTSITGTLLGVARDYRIEWNVNSASFYVKNTTNSTYVKVAERSTTYFSNLRVSPSDFTSGDGNLVLGALKLTPYTGGLTTTFSGSSLPTNWSQVQEVAGSGAYSVSGGNLTLNGVRSGTDTVFRAGQRLEFNATFHPTAEYQHVGFGENYAGTNGIIFSTQAGGALYAYTPDGTSVIDTTTTGPLLGTARDYRIDWSLFRAVFYVKSTTTGQWIEVANRASNVYTNLRISPSDANSSDGGSLIVGSIGLVGTPGTFESRVFDAGRVIDWDSLSWNATVPSTTSAVFQMRTGSTALPDTSWTSWSTVASSGATFNRTGQYFQYRILLTGSSQASPPVVRDVTTRYHPIYTDTTTADFSTGTFSNTEVTNVSGGEVSLSLDEVSGVFVSRVVDGGNGAVWTRVVWNATVPTDSALLVSYRSGSTSTPDGSWTSFTQVASGAAISVNGRYIQYQVAYTAGSAGETPALNDVTLRN